MRVNGKAVHMILQNSCPTGSIHSWTPRLAFLKKRQPANQSKPHNYTVKESGFQSVLSRWYHDAVSTPYTWGKRFHGKLKMLIDNMREAGMTFNYSTSSAAAAAAQHSR